MNSLAVGSFVRNNFWKMKTPDPSLGIPPRESCCFVDHIFRDISQYPLTLAIVGAVGWACFEGGYRKDYISAGVLAAFALVFFAAFVRIWQLRVNSDIGKNVIALAKERQALQQQLLDQQLELQNVNVEADKLIKLTESSKKQFEETKANGETFVLNFAEENAKLKETAEKYKQLLEIYEKSKAEVAAIKAQISGLSGEVERRESDNKRLEKGSSLLKHSTEHLSSQVNKFDGENKEFNGENDEMVVLLKSLKDEVNSLQAYIGQLKALLVQVSLAEELALRKIEESRKQDVVLAGLDEEDRKLTLMEEAALGK